MDTIKGFDLVRTCYACPEQYDVYLDGEELAYLRLRHGSFYAQAPFGGSVVYSARPLKSDGIFDDNEREYYLNNAIDAIIEHYLKLDKIELVGCHDCKSERYTLKDNYHIKCYECSPFRNVFHYKKQ